MQSHLISRRSLIRSSLIGLACSAVPAISAAEKDDWTETYDVVIIGSGFAGLAAAYSALENGVKSVLVLEKMNVFGGNSCINGGQISLAGSGLQKSKGIKDSPKLMEEDMLRVSQRLNHPALVKAVVKESPACYDMMVKCGVKFADQVIRLGGHSAPRTIFAENYAGGGICVPMHKWLKDHGVEFRNKSFCSAVLTDKDGVVRGVEVEGQYDFDKKTHKNTYKVQAVKGVVFATGGWGADNEFISASTPQYSTLESTSQKGATSESVRMLLGLGAMPVLLDIYQVGP